MAKNELIINRIEEGEKLTFALAGEINTMTGKAMDAELENLNCKELVFDFAELNYTTSSGIRILLTAKQKMLKRGGDMYVINVNEAIKDVLEIVGLYDQFVRE